MKIRRPYRIGALLLGVSVTLGSCAVVAEQGYSPHYRHHRNHYRYDYRYEYRYRPRYHPRRYHDYHHYPGGYYHMRLESGKGDRYSPRETYVSVSMPTGS